MQYNMRNFLLVTGANGFLGSEILRQAISSKIRVAWYR